MSGGDMRDLPEPDPQDVLNRYRQRCADLELVVARQDSVIRQLLAERDGRDDNPTHGIQS